MGRIKTQLAKRIGQDVFDSHSEVLTTDFAKNKLLCSKIMHIPSKKLRNVVVGYITRLAKRAQQNN